MCEDNTVTKSKKYRKDFLHKVLVKIDFDSSLPIANTGPAKNIYSTVKKRFPTTEEKKIIGKELVIGPETLKERKTETKEWHYHDGDRKKHLIISSEAMSVTYDVYEYYEKLSEDFIAVLDALFVAYPSLQVKRFGLRYINNIQIKEDAPTNWDKYLKTELNSIFCLADKPNTISRAFHVLEFNYGEDFLRFQFGMFNSDYPAPIKKKAYTLDYDMYATKILDRSEIKPTMDRFHKKINNSFEEVITDKLRGIMEPIIDG